MGQTQIAKVKGGFQVMAVVQPKAESEVEKLKKDIETLKQQRVESTIELKAKEQEINKLKAHLNVKDDEVRLDLNKKDDMIELLQSKVQDLT